ncbi:hypothetical protein [Aquabacterium sp.]|uniref:hypothetical protein n=1 Tax=Aquabacterium sp. TaxID=1872578 RepID=UPI002E3038AC|nr:hypothetical protein [Aquabacterium sp.]HEX5310424.1 hypothetical protein [Aquabacterium sp.]
MKQPKLRHLPLAAAALVACSGAYAGYQSPDGNFNLSGFGTLGAVSTSTNDVQFNYPGQGGGAGKRPSFTPDTKLALQGTYKFVPSVSATAQLMSKYDAVGQFTPGFDWAFVKWQAAPALNFRVGKMGAPFFMISDFRNVGYANTAVRPNLDVYGQVPTDKMEGIDVTYQYNLGSTTLNATFYAGNAKDDYTSALRKGSLELGPSNFELSRLKGINLTAETDSGLTLRAGYAKSKFNLTSDSIDTMLQAGNCLASAVAQAECLRTSRALNPDGQNLLYNASGTALLPYINALGTSYTGLVNANAVTQNKNISFLGFGATYDQDNWIVTAEYTKRRSDNFVADTTGWYVNLGYRVGHFTPYVALSRLSVDSYNVDHNPAAPTTGSAAIDGVGSVQALRTGLRDSLQAFMNVESLSQRTYTVGSRWDVMPNVALKAQWDQIHKPANHWGLFFTPDPTTPAAQSFLNNPRKVNVLTLSMDVVF